MRPPIPPAPHPGGCLCGAVRYRIEMQPMAVNACHCTDCKRSSGAPFAVFLHVARDRLVVERPLVEPPPVDPPPLNAPPLNGGDLIRFRKTADSGREIDIARCARCGTRVWHEPLAAPQLVFVAAGTLDDPSWVVATSHIWTSRMAADVVAAPDALIFEEAPSDRQAIWDRFSELYPGLA